MTGLAITLPVHWADLFAHDRVVHLGPVYLAALVFVVGAALTRRELRPLEPDRVAQGAGRLGAGDLSA